MLSVMPEILEGAQQRQQTTEEPPYRVIIYNDPVTPMDFVVIVLRQIFLLSGPRAVQVMYTAHINNSAYVQTLPRSEAQRRIHRAHFTSRLQGFPLSFTLEQE